MAIIENLACDLCEKPSSDYLSTQINTLIETAANGLFKKHLVNKKLEQKCFPSNSWFDSECKLLKNEVNRFGHQHDIAIPKNSDTYFDLCKKYKQLVRKKKRTNIKKFKQELQCLTTENPNNYWGFLKNLKRKYTQDEVNIDLSDFYFCFLKQSTPPQGQIDSSLLENRISSWKDGNPPFNIKQDIANNILNSNITSCEIIHALKKLKKGKSPGIDGISLEFIKSDMITSCHCWKHHLTIS